MTREDAERILQAVKDRERAPSQNLRAQPKDPKKEPPSSPEKDW